MQSAAEGTIANAPWRERPAAADVGCGRRAIQALWAFNREIGLWPPQHSPRSTPDSVFPEVDFFLPAGDKACHRRFPDPIPDRTPWLVFKIRQAAAQTNQRSPAPSPQLRGLACPSNSQKKQCSASREEAAAFPSNNGNRFPMDPPGRLFEVGKSPLPSLRIRAFHTPLGIAGSRKSITIHVPPARSLIPQFSGSSRAAVAPWHRRARRHRNAHHCDEPRQSRPVG